MGKCIDLVGQRFNRWYVMSGAGKNKWNESLFLCRCNCGTEKVVNGNSLRSGRSQSCGCLRKERVSERLKDKPKSEEQKKKISESMKNPNITDEERIVRREYPEYNDWRTAVYEQDAFTCQYCGTKKSPFNAHHIESYGDNPELRTEVSNGITLCKKHHDDFHHQYGRGNNTREQLNEFLRSK